ncbi:MAG TPA: tetratricopeptide repeat protein, partial [Blastocatellia bacterium]|nr:tetratricopeptide repeat protein [Blastocatellia bacterium]
MLRQVRWFVILFCFFSPATNFKPSQALGQANALRPGSSIAKDISAGQTHSYTISLSSNSYLHLVAEQRGVDIFLELLDPSGKSLVETYSPIGSQGAENLYFIAESAGDYTLQVRSVHSTAVEGGYTLTLLAVRAPSPEDLRRAAAQRDYFDGEKLRASDLEQSLRRLQKAVQTFSSLGEERQAAIALIGQGRTHNFSGKPQLAQECFEQSLALFRKAEDKNGEALALYRLAEVYGYQDWRREMEFHQRAFALTQATNNQILEAYVLSGLGDVHRASGQLAEAQSYYERARQLQSLTGDERSAASTLVQMGTFFYVQSKFQASLEAYRQAARIFRRLQLLREEANALIGVGNIWLLIGEYEKAAEQFEQSLKAAQSGGYRHVEAIAQTNLGVAQLQMEQYAAARQTLERAFQLGEIIGDVGIRAESRQRLGDVFAAEGQHAQAQANFKQALEFFREQSSPNGEAEVSFSIGRLQYQLSQLVGQSAALNWFQLSLEKWQSLGDRLGMARALSALSRVHLALNRRDEALRCNQQALTLIEALRSDLLSYDLRATLSATFQTVYEQQIALLMRRHRQNPALGEDRQALQVSERARARSLLEQLSEARAEVRAGVDAELLAAERETQR